MAIVNDVVTRFSFEGSLTKLQNYNSMLSTTIASLAKWSAGAFAAGTAVSLFVNRIASGNESLIQLSRTTRVSIERIQQLGFAASQLGSSSEAVESTLSSLSRSIGSAAQRGSEEFLRLGISVRGAGGQIKKADQLLLEISDRFRRFKLSFQEKQDFASRLGIDPSLVKLLGTSSVELQKLFDKANRLGVLSRRDADALSEYNDSVSQLKFGLRSLNNQIALGLAPTLKNLADRFVLFLIQNQDFIKRVIEKGADVFVSFGGAVKRLGGLVLSLGQSFGASKGQILALGAVLAVIALPIEATTLAIIGALLALDDLIVGVRGGKSVLIDFFKSVGSSIRDDFMAEFNFFKDALKDTTIGDAFKKAFEQVSFILEKIADSIRTIRGLLKESTLGSATSSLGNLVKDAFSLPTLNFSAQDAVPTNNSSLGLLGQSSSLSSTSNVSQNNVFNIQSDNPTEVARTVHDTLQNQLNNANDQFSASGGF